MNKIYRNGDFTFIETKDSEIKGEKHKNIYRFATGEATNHHHEIVADKAEDFEIVKKIGRAHV